MEIISASTAETKKLAETLAKRIKPGMVLALFGDLGSGKTTFVSYLVKALGFESRVQSPTFVIHREYIRQSGSPISIIHHLDLYRLSSKEDILDLGLKELLQEKNSLVLIEWPEMAVDLLPAGTVELHFKTMQNDVKHIIVKGLD